MVIKKSFARSTEVGMRFNYGKIFLLGFGFFGISIIWGVYNAFVPVFLAEKFQLDVRWIGLSLWQPFCRCLLLAPLHCY
jgi:maltose/moltooligosaccharide transporter